LHTILEHQQSVAPVALRETPPAIAFGSGVTLAAVLNVLHRAGIPSYAVCPEADFVRQSRWYRALPAVIERPQPADLVTLLEALPLEAAVLLPCSDDWLRAVADLPSHLVRRFRSSTPGACVEMLADKWKFAQLLDLVQIPHPGTHLIQSLEQFDTLEESIFQGAILKPLSSVEFASKHGVKGYVTENRERAREAFLHLDLPIMVQEFIPGPPTAGYFLDGFRDRTGQISALFARRRLRMYPPQLGNSTFIESVPVRAVNNAALLLECLLEKIGYRGIFSAEFKFDERDRLFKLIEINARAWWYVEFAANCGVDVCSMAYQDALGIPVEPVTGYQIGRRCVFALNDFRAWKDSPSAARASFVSVLRNWIQSDTTPFHWNDPRPALRYLERSVTGFLRSKFGADDPVRAKPSPQLARP
jgi:predicted ATP-grasp superfamily ATP-dependent carboligase